MTFGQSKDHITSRHAGLLGKVDRTACIIVRQDFASGRSLDNVHSQMMTKRDLEQFLYCFQRLESK